MFINKPKIPWDNLVFPKWDIKPLKDQVDKPVIGFDTETLNGYAKIITDSTGYCLDIDGIDDILKYLNYKPFRSSFNFFYNLKFDIQALLKYLPEKNIKDIALTGKTEYGKYKLFYIPKKLLSISYSKHSVHYYDIFQYYNTSLENAANTYLTIKKEPDGLDRALIGTSKQYWIDNYDSIKRYCIQDSVVCQGLAQLVKDTIINYLDIVPKSFVSTANLSKHYFRNNCTFPNIHKDIPTNVLIMSYNCYSGGWFEMFKKGFFKGPIYDSDINSAYPDAIRNFPDLVKGTWKQVTGLHKKALLGYYFVEVYPDSNYINPFPIDSTVKIYPKGSFMTYLTKKELESYQTHNDINIIYGWEYYDPSPVYPYNYHIQKLYDLKTILKNNNQTDRFQYSLYKIIMNSFYGVTWEKIELNEKERKKPKNKNKTHKVALLFNPVLASYITGFCRATIYDPIKDNQENIIAIATDGILSDIRLDIPESDKLGEWTIKKYDELLMFQPGIYSIGGKIKTRGMQKGININTGDKTYKNLFEYFKSEPYRNKYPISINRPVGLKESLIRKKYTIEDINNFQDFVSLRDINTDQKRIWSKKFMSGGQLLKHHITSKPITLI